MEVSGPGKSPSTTLSFRYNANNEELEELFNDDDPPTPQCDPPSTTQSENPSPKRGDKTSIIDKYFKSIRTEKLTDKTEKEEAKVDKPEEGRSSTPKEISSSPMKEYLNRLGKRNTPDSSTDVKEGTNETWKIFHDFKFKIAQAVEDMKTRSLEETKEKSVPRENSISDSEDNSAVKDLDQQSVGDTDNQVSSLESSIQNLSDITQPLTAKITERELSLPVETKNNSDSCDDTHKNLVYSEMADVRDYMNDVMMDVESGVEAMEEDTMDSFGEVTNANPEYRNVEKGVDSPNLPPSPTPTNFRLPPSKSNLQKKTESETKKYFLNFTMYFLTLFLILSYVLFPNANVWNGFLLGIWFVCLVNNVKHWLLDTYFSDWEPQKGSFFQVKRSISTPTYTIPSVKEHQPLKKYEGWINHYRFPDYDPYTYHINKTTTAFMKLEGCNLRISYTRTKVAKRALWDEKIDKAVFYQHRLYNLTGARVILLPKGLVQRRQWSKKYPICVILNEKEKIQVLEKENAVQPDRKTSDVSEKKKDSMQHETESTETNTSPEKKKKFVWRRREKIISHPEPSGTPEPGKEGLRHRLVRKMHRDKKTDSVSTGTEPQDQASNDKKVMFEDAVGDDMEITKSTTSNNKYELEDDFDETELTRIKEFLEEAESEVDGTVEGEWSVHVKQSKDKHSHLYLFARTGRDKHEWFRRLGTAISEANVASAESSASDDKSPADAAHENKDGIELAVYKLTEKDTVAFAKNTNKNLETMSEGVTITSLSQPVPADSDNYEKNFWPYLLKILENHDLKFKQTCEIGVSCQIEPTPQDRTKNKKKKKITNKHSPVECNCRTLPAEVTWVNTALARMFYDVMRDPLIIARVQNRIQRKLNTLKLPSFMSPLNVEELSLAGACPLVERVCPPAWDARGVWLDADLRYDGGAYIALSTQINLMKLKEKRFPPVFSIDVTLEDQLLAANENVVENDMNCSVTGGIFSEKQLRKRKPAIYDSEVEDSAESSSDDESPPVQPVDSAENMPVTESTSSVPRTSVAETGGSSKKKFLRMVDKIATNKYFQQVTDYKYVKRAMEGLSNTDIKLHLEIHGLEGRLALNLPPPPHDRIWIGFRTNPQLILKARPAVGARTLRFAHISNWIEQKLSKEFEKVLVLPNMEDIIVDVMTPTPVNFE